MSFLSLHMHLALFMMLSLAFSGCSKPWVMVAEYPRSVRGIEAGDGITVVRRHLGYLPGHWFGHLEEWVGSCISSAMVKRNLSVRFIHPDEFRRVVFPDMDITSEPITRESILKLLESPQIRDKIKSLNLRYLIIVGHRSDHRDVAGWLHGIEPFFITMGAVFDNSTEFLADIIDMKMAADCGDVRVTVQKRGYCGLVCVIPVFLPAFTKGLACKTLGPAVTNFLLGEKNGELSK